MPKILRFPKLYHSIKTTQTIIITVCLENALRLLKAVIKVEIVIFYFTFLWIDIKRKERPSNLFRAMGI